MTLRRAAVLTLLLCVFLVPGSAWAKSFYVTDKLQVTVRSGPTVENKVIALLESGDQVQLLETNDKNWAKVQLDSGKQGWMISRYLQEDKTAALKLSEIDPQAKNLMAKVGELESENQRLKAELAQAKSQSGTLEKDYNKLKKESSDVISLKKQHQNLKQEFAQQAKRLDQVSAEAESLRFGSSLKWFLSGAGVLFVGWMIGLAMGRRKKRWSSSIN